MNVHKRTPSMTSGIRVLFAAAAAVTLVACGDPTLVKARYNVVTDTLGLFAVNGTPQEAPSALVLSPFGAQPARVTSTFEFQVAFDIDSNGNPVVIPVQVLASDLASSQRVGVQRTSGSFDQITKAPLGGYVYDSLLVLTPGAPVALEIADQFACQMSYTSIVYYAKAVVDSIDLDHRTMLVRLTVNPNCGFRSFAPGIPKD